MQAIKTRSRTLIQKCWRRHLWARGFFVATTGNVAGEVIAKFVGEQKFEDQDDDFKVSK